MKALVTVAFALELPDDDEALAVLTREIDESMFNSIKDRFTLERYSTVTLGEFEGKIDWYGAVISLRRPVFEGIAE